LRLRPSAFATFLVWQLRTGACGVGACGLALMTATRVFLLHTRSKRVVEIRFNSGIVLLKQFYYYSVYLLLLSQPERLESDAQST